MNPCASDASWHQALSGLGGTSIRAGRKDWLVFQRGPFRIAYPAFPVGLGSGDMPVAQCVASALPELRRARIDLLRLSAPEDVMARFECNVLARLPESRIETLQAWDRRSLSASVRRKLRKGERAGLQMRAVEPGDGKLLHGLYERTVRRQRGAVRYTLRYFEGLCLAGPEHLDAKVMLDEVATGFIAVLHQGTDSIYLHGGYADSHASLRPGYFAMAWAIEASRGRGNQSFNMLASPLGQTALREYKESFGAMTRWRVYWQQSLTLRGKSLAAVLRLLGSRSDRGAQASALNKTSA